MRRRSHGYTSMAGFTLVEVMITIVLVTFAVIGTVSSILFIREALELDKQRLVALNYARQQVEISRRNLFPALGINDTIVIDNFNTPTDDSDDLFAELTTSAWVIEIDRSLTPVTLASQLDGGRIVLLEVAIEWQRVGRLSDRTMREVLHTYVAPR